MRLGLGLGFGIGFGLGVGLGVWLGVGMRAHEAIEMSSSEMTPHVASTCSGPRQQSGRRAPIQAPRR